MSETTPTIRISDKDGDGPAKRLRRPALSCVECRVRKVKCDRQKPCRACTRISSPTCTYRPKRSYINERSTAGTSAFADREANEENAASARTTFQKAASSDFDLLVNRYVAPGIFGEHGKHRPLSVTKGIPGHDSQAQLGDSTIVGSLLERIRKLESRETARDEQANSSVLPVRGGSGTSEGSFIKSKFYGQSHWMNAIEPYETLGDANVIVNPITERKEVNKKSELYGTVANIKRMARIIKTSRLRQPSLPQEVRGTIPPKDVCDELVKCYLRTFESFSRILHVPSFHREYENYWSGANSEKPSLILKILLVCAIGSTFYTGPEQAFLRASCGKWINAADSWLHGPHTKSKLNMAGIQISILALYARQLCAVDGDHIWIPAGSLLRTAMHLGLHRDPEHFSKINTFHREMRRRLWATVLEITVQSSLDMGMPPLISAEDYDTKPPSNVNDDDISEGQDFPLEEKPSSQYTDCSMQIAFVKTLPIRLEVIRLINNLRFELAYEDVLKIGKELTVVCHEHTVFLKSALNAGHSITPFQIKLADSLVRRFILCLHRPYFAKAKNEPQYYFSRKICLETSLAISAPATEPVMGQEDDWTRMTMRCVGFFKSFYLYAMSTVYLELESQIDEQKNASAIFTPMIGSSSTQQKPAFELSAQAKALREVLVSANDIATARLRRGETNAKGVIFLMCALARIDALVSGEDPEKVVLEVAKKGVRLVSHILAQTYEAEHGVPINLNVYNPSKDSNRGEGADDITGRHLPMGTEVAHNIDSGLRDVSFDLPGRTDGVSGETSGFDPLGSNLTCLVEDIDFDINAYLAGQSTSFASDGHHFGRSPEWFYDLGELDNSTEWSISTGM